MKPAFVWVVAIFALACLVLGYGYWHAETHGAAYFSLRYENPQPAKPGGLSKAAVRFKDLQGNLLAEGVVDDAFDFVHLINPQTGDCHEVETRAAYSAAAKTSWHECFAKQSAWIPTWIDKVRQVQIVHENCTSIDIPIEIVSSNSEWLLWWVPHPHIGGKPYRYSSAIIVVGQADCKAKPG